jgi:hypothetical protein
VAYYHPRKGFDWAKPTSIFAPTSVDVEPLPLYTQPPAAQPEQEPDRRALQAAGIHPAPCARHCEAKAFGIEIRSLKSALRTALEQPEQEQDCVGWFGYDTGLRLWFEANKGDDGAIPLYKARGAT